MFRLELTAVLFMSLTETEEYVREARKKKNKVCTWQPRTQPKDGAELELCV